MSNLTISELLSETEREFGLALGGVTATSCETFGESSYRGGFRLVLENKGRKFHVLYSDMQLEVSFSGREIFGNNIHTGFEGNMFSREHLRQYLSRIAASVATAVETGHTQG